MIQFKRVGVAIALGGMALLLPAWLLAQGRGGRANNPFPGGTNPDGSLRPTRAGLAAVHAGRLHRYAILEPGSESFRINFLPEETRAGATELVNATRGGSEGSGVEVYDPRTGKPLKFTYEQQSRTIRRTTPSTPRCRSRCRRAASAAC